MSTMAFDTYTAAKRLRGAGFNEHQAEAAVTMVRDAIGADQEARATKADVDTAISGLESRLTARMDILEVRMGTLEVRMDALEARIDTLETRMVDTFATKGRACRARNATDTSALRRGSRRRRGQRHHRRRAQGALIFTWPGTGRLPARDSASLASAKCVIELVSNVEPHIHRPDGGQHAESYLRIVLWVTAMVDNSSISLFRLMPRYRASSFNRACVSSGKRRVDVVICHSPVISSPGVGAPRKRFVSTTIRIGFHKEGPRPRISRSFCNSSSYRAARRTSDKVKRRLN